MLLKQNTKSVNYTAWVHYGDFYVIKIYICTLVIVYDTNNYKLAFYAVFFSFLIRKRTVTVLRYLCMQFIILKRYLVLKYLPKCSNSGKKKEVLRAMFCSGMHNESSYYRFILTNFLRLNYWYFPKMIFKIIRNMLAFINTSCFVIAKLSLIKI